MLNLNDVIKASFRRSLSFLSKNSKYHSHSSTTKAKRHTPHTLALEAALFECRKEAKKCIRWRIIPSSQCFELAAMLFRQAKNYQNEVKICQLYISLVNECVSKKTLNRQYTEKKAREQCGRISMRLEAAQKLHEKFGMDAAGIDVEYIRNG